MIYQKVYISFYLLYFVRPGLEKGWYAINPEERGDIFSVFFPSNFLLSGPLFLMPVL